MRVVEKVVLVLMVMAKTLTVGERERSNIWWSNGSLGCDGESQRERIV